jgi:hypothetical protein
MPPKRVVFLHYHIFKNAGTTIDLVLEQELGTTFRLEAEAPDDSIGSDVLLEVLEQRPDILFVSSHALRPPRPTFAGYHLVDIVFLRHPIDRFRSIFDFSRALFPDGNSTAEAAQRFGLADFAAWMANETPWNFFDPQTTFMGNRGDFFFPPTEQAYYLAKQRTLDVRLLGTVELLAESFQACNRYLQGVRPNIALRPPNDPANATTIRAKTLHERVELVRQTLGRVPFAHLEEALRRDLQLWEVASAEVMRRYELCSPWLLPAPSTRQHQKE